MKYKIIASNWMSSFNQISKTFCLKFNNPRFVLTDNVPDMIVNIPIACNTFLENEPINNAEFIISTEFLKDRVLYIGGFAHEFSHIELGLKTISFQRLFDYFAFQERIIDREVRQPYPSIPLLILNKVLKFIVERSSIHIERLADNHARKKGFKESIDYIRSKHPLKSKKIFK